MSSSRMLHHGDSLAGGQFHGLGVVLFRHVHQNPEAFHVDETAGNVGSYGVKVAVALEDGALFQNVSFFLRTHVFIPLC